MVELQVGCCYCWSHGQVLWLLSWRPSLLPALLRKFFEYFYAKQHHISSRLDVILQHIAVQVVKVQYNRVNSPCGSDEAHLRYEGRYSFVMKELANVSCRRSVVVRTDARLISQQQVESRCIFCSQSERSLGLTTSIPHCSHSPYSPSVFCCGKRLRLVLFGGSSARVHHRLVSFAARRKLA